MNNKHNDYDERLKYRVGRAKIIIIITSILITILAYVILGIIPKTDGEDPIYYVEMFLWWAPAIIFVVLIGDGKGDNGHKTPGQWSSFMIAQFLKEKDRKKELKKNPKEQQVTKPNNDNSKDDDWSAF